MLLSSYSVFDMHILHVNGIVVKSCSAVSVVLNLIRRSPDPHAQIQATVPLSTPAKQRAHQVLQQIRLRRARGRDEKDVHADLSECLRCVSLAPFSAPCISETQSHSQRYAIQRQVARVAIQLLLLIAESQTLKSRD